MKTNRVQQMLVAMKNNKELATSKQLWVINDLCEQLGHNYSLPLSKYEACLIITKLKEEETITPEDMSDESDIIRFTGWTMATVEEWKDDIVIEHGLHPDDDHQEILERVIMMILDDAKEHLLNKYYIQWLTSQA